MSHEELNEKCIENKIKEVNEKLQSDLDDALIGVLNLHELLYLISYYDSKEYKENFVRLMSKPNLSYNEFKRFVNVLNKPYDAHYISQKAESEIFVFSNLAGYKFKGVESVLDDVNIEENIASIISEFSNHKSEIFGSLRDNLKLDSEAVRVLNNIKDYSNQAHAVLMNTFSDSVLEKYIKESKSNFSDEIHGNWDRISEWNRENLNEFSMYKSYLKESLGKFDELVNEHKQSDPIFWQTVSPISSVYNHYNLMSVVNSQTIGKVNYFSERILGVFNGFSKALLEHNNLFDGCKKKL
ncbi:MAG: hypothetical protein GWP09_02890 [Nitrospiraceae bacterium]|nr:hypothetical protein [Nitrospiraceae bacterium]